MPAELLSIATRLPTNVLAREQTIRHLPEMTGRERGAEHLARLVDNSHIERRYTVVPLDALLALGGPRARAQLYRERVLDLGEAVAREALAGSGLAPSEVGCIVTVSCTGFMIPAMDVYLMPRLGLRPDVRRIPVTELGCSAGAWSLGLAGELSASGGGAALVVAVELCSLCIQTTEVGHAEMLGNLLFGDGAAAAVIGSEVGRGPVILASRSVVFPDTTHLLGMHLSDTGLRLILAKELPQALSERLPPVVDDFLAGQGLRRDELAFWAVHPGGPRVLDAVGRALALPAAALEPSWRAWNRVGNVSSAMVFFILGEVQAAAPPPGSLGMVMAFGPGLSCEMSLMRAGGWLGSGA